MVDPAVVLEKIVVDLGGLKPGYLGPPYKKPILMLSFQIERNNPKEDYQNKGGRMAEFRKIERQDSWTQTAFPNTSASNSKRQAVIVTRPY
jgi:hypothetical protein